MLDLTLQPVDLDQLANFNQIGCASSIACQDIPPAKTLKIFSSQSRERSLVRTDLPIGWAEVQNCLFFGKYVGNGVSNMRAGKPFREYDGGQFICSRDGFFVPDMLFAGSALPTFVKRTGKSYRLMHQAEFTMDDGRDCVFMGAYHSHFGHCLVESMTRLWYLLHLSAEERTRKKFIFFQGWGSEGGPIAEILPWLGVPKKNIVICNQNILFANLTIPSFGWRPWNQWDIFLSKEFYTPMKVIRDMAVRKASCNYGAEKVYLTRSKLATSQTRHNNRELNIKRSELLENDVATRGFVIVAPESMAFADQIAMIGRASHIVGPAGSAHHLAAFAYSAVAQIILTHEGFWMGGNDSVFAWDKSMDLSYVFGRQVTDPSHPALTAAWDFEVADWEKAASAYGL